MSTPDTKSKKGMTPWNKGTVGVMKPNSGSFQEGHPLGKRFEKGKPAWNSGTAKPHYCKLEDCSRIIHKDGICSMHYVRFARTGTYNKRPHNWANTKKWIEKTCKCGRVFSVTPSRKDKAVACSKECVNKGKIPWNRLSPEMVLSTETARSRFQATVRKQVLKRDNYTCQICQSTSGTLHVDHIKAFSKHPELRYEVDNCRTLCVPCHYYVTFKRNIPDGSKWGLSLRQQRRISL